MLTVDYKGLFERLDRRAWLPRVLIAAMFVESGIDKALHWGS